MSCDEAEPSQPILVADHRRGGAVADRRTHGNRQRPGDDPRGENLVDSHRRSVLREGIELRVVVVLGRDRREMPLGRAIGAHVKLRQIGVDVHEQAALAGRRDLAFGRCRPAPEVFQTGGRLGGGGDVPGPFEDGEALGLVGGHLFGANRERDIGQAGLYLRVGQAERGARTGAGVLDVDDRGPLEADVAQRNLTGHHVLAVHVGLGDVPVEGRPDVAGRRPRIRHGGPHGILRQALGGGGAEATEGRHADADNVDLAHGFLPRTPAAFIRDTWGRCDAALRLSA